MSKPLPEGKLIELDASMRMHYLDFEPDESQELHSPVVFVHGSGPGASGWSNFKANVQAFVDAGHRCVILDLPGYGFTSKPTDAVYDLDYFVGHLNAFLEALEINRCVLVGNSLGGAISIGYTLKYPERVNGLILMAPGGVEEREVYFNTEGIQAMVKYPMGSPQFTRDVLKELLGLLVYDVSIVDDQLVDERWQILQTQNSQVLASMSIPNLDNRLAEIRCPVLGFWGSDDKFCPISGADKILKGCPDTRMHLRSQCGHWVMTEYPEYFNRQCLEFLEYDLESSPQG